MRAPHQEGDFPFPVKYGYSAVGVVESGPERLRTECIRAFSASGSMGCAPVDDVVPVPEGVPPRRAVLAANMETALNGVWDAA